MKEILNKIPFATLIIIYLFLCGLMYLTSFWSTFDIDVFNLISIYDIPKSFVFPFLITHGFLIINILTGSITALDDDVPYRKTFVEIKDYWGTGKKTILAFLTTIDFTVIIINTLLISIIKNPFYNILYWVIISLVITMYLQYRFCNLPIIKETFKAPLLRGYIGYIIVFLPISCFSTGKILSLRVYNNEKIVTMEIIKSKDEDMLADTIEVKLLGFISENYLYSTIDNKRTYILNRNAVDGIVLEKTD